LEIASNVWTAGSIDTIFRIIITLKPSGGARYEVYKNGDFTAPIATHDTTGNTREQLKPAFFVYYASTSTQLTMGQMGVGVPLQGTRISGNSISTGKIESINYTSAVGSQINLDEGTIKLGGATNPSFAVDAYGNVTASNALLDGYAAAQALRAIPIIITPDNHTDYCSGSVTDQGTHVTTIFLDGSGTGSQAKGYYPDRVGAHCILRVAANEAVATAGAEIGAIVNIVPPELPGGEAVQVTLETSSSAVELCIEINNTETAFGYAYGAMSTAPASPSAS
jgi:hypothetical protein